MRRLISFLSRWQLLALLLLAGVAAFGVTAAVVGYDAARLVRDIDAADAIEMQVERLEESGRWPVVLHAVGRMPHEETSRAVRVYRQDLRAIIATGRLTVLATGVLDEPYVMKRWYDDQGFVRVGDFVLTWHYIVTILALVVVLWMLLYRRHELRRVPQPPRSFDLHPAMMRVDPRYAPLVRRLEGVAAADPDGYRRRVVAAGFLGYAVLGGALIVTAGASGAGAWIAIAARAGLLLKFIIPLVMLSFVVLRAFWVRVPKPNGRALDPAAAPGLFALTERLRQAMNGPRLHELLLVDSFNAAIVQRPRFGIFGWNRNTLIVGLPLALAMTPQEFETVVAHEYGHLAGAHGRFAAWAYRVRLTWSRLADDLARRGGFTGAPLRRFFAWYAPWFNAYSFVLARANEYAADRMAAAVTDAGVAAAALLRAEIAARHLDQVVWPGIAASARHAAEPPRAFAAIATALAAGIEIAPATRHLRAALAGRTDLHDTHPALGDRLRALGADARPPAPMTGSAAQALFGPALPKLIAENDAAWQAAVVDHWADLHATAEAERARLAELDAAAANGTIGDAVWERALLTGREHGDDAALPLLRDIIAADRDHAPASFALGRILLARDDPAGLELLERAMALDPEAVVSACEIAAAFLAARGEVPAAEGYRARGDAARQEHEAAVAERSSLGGDALFEPHRLSAGELAAVTTALAEDPAVDRAWLVRKQVRHRPDSPVHVVLVRFRRLSRRKRPMAARELAGAISARGVPGEIWGLADDWVNWRLARRGRTAAGEPLDLGR